MSSSLLMELQQQQN